MEIFEKYPDEEKQEVIKVILETTNNPISGWENPYFGQKGTPVQIFFMNSDLLTN